MTPAVLFARRTSVYKDLACDVWDEDRDARKFAGGVACVAHPPCRGWGRLRAFAKVAPGELDLARFAVAAVRANGGVLEHPAFSSLWRDQDLPPPGAGYDHSGGWTLSVDQSWWGHRAPKATWLYIVGIGPRAIPSFPFHLGMAEHRVEWMGKAEREATPPAFASWLLDLAGRVS
jgi:hypothetical protein